MKMIIISFFLMVSFLYADEFDLEPSSSSDSTTLFPISDVDLESFTPVVFKITEKELREFIPILPRMLSEEEQMAYNLKVSNAKAVKKEKIASNFTTKETLKKVEKVKTEVKANSADADFFNTLDYSDSKPIDME